MADDFVRDAYGRPLKVGDKVMLTNGEPPTYTIVDLVPIVHPKAPPGAVMLVLRNTFKLPAEGGAVLPHFVRTVAAEELQSGEKTDVTAGLTLTDGPGKKSTLQ